jgi:hypothetical protein
VLISMTEITSPAKKPLQYDNHPVPIKQPQTSCEPWPHKRHCRRRFHKAFFRWYAANEEKFAIKLELLKRTDSTLEIGFCHISRVITAQLTDDEIGIPIDWNDVFWDVIQWFETYPRRVPGGYVCRECPEDTRLTFPTREELWRIEVFEPFLAWVNDDLAKAETVAVSGNPDGSTWARLAGPSSV